MWLSSKVDCKPGTINAYRGLLQSRVLPKWGDTPLGAIGHGAIRQWVAKLAGEVSPARVRSCLLVHRQVLDLAVADGRLARNVSRGVPLPRQAQRSEHRYLTHEDVVALAAAAGEHGTAILTLAYVGLRFGELGRVSVVERAGVLILPG